MGATRHAVPDWGGALRLRTLLAIVDASAIEELLDRGRHLAIEDRSEEAEEAFDEALRLARGSSLWESRVCCGLGTLYARDGRTFEAIMLYRYSLDQARRASDRMMQVRLLANLCSLFTELERWDPVATHLAQADTVIATLSEDERIVAEELIIWSRFHWALRSRDVPLARTYLIGVRAFMKQHGDPSNTALLRAWEADLLLLEGKPLSALEVLEEAAAIEGVSPSYALDVRCRTIECLMTLRQDEDAEALSKDLLCDLEEIAGQDPLSQVSHETAATLGRYLDLRGLSDLALRAYDIAATTALRRIVQLAACIERIPELADTHAEDHHHMRSLRGEYLGVHREILDRVARLLELSPQHIVFSGPSDERVIRVCAWCGLVGTRDGAWIPVAHLLSTSVDVPVTHGICTRCQQKIHRS